MLYKPIQNFNHKRQAAFIYNVVFNSTFSVLLVCFLFASFMVQPVHQAFASEPIEDLIIKDEEAGDDVVADDVKEHEATDESEDEGVGTVEDIDVEDDPVEGDVESDNVSEEESDGSDEVVTEEDESESESEDPELPSDDDQENDGQASSTEGVVDDSEEEDVVEDETSATSTDEQIVDTGVSTSSATSSEQSTGTSEDSNSDDNDEGSTTGGSGGDSDEDDIETEAETDGESTSAEDNDDETSTTTEEVLETDLATTSATTSEEVSENVIEVESLVSDANYYQFNKKACVAISDSTFHCSLDAQSPVDVNAIVYSELGVSGNMEIFLRTSDGEIRQLTDNIHDDTSPHYDAETLQVVWQRQIDGRFQIILYDIEEEEEKQLTFSRTNNMEPKVSEVGIVWQAWDGNDWEIMYFDGKYTDQLTDNISQDVAPTIDDGYVLWSVLGSEEQEAKVYSIESGETLSISGYEGGVIANPRFVLVYDTKFDNGDIITQGFDPDTGLSQPIAAKPTDDPVELPNTDSTGETRALIQNKSSQKDEKEFDELGSSNPSDATGSSTAATSTTSVESDDTLDLSLSPVTEFATTSDDFSEAAVEEIDSTPTTTEEVFELTDFDLVLTPTETATSSEAEDVEDSVE